MVWERTGVARHRCSGRSPTCSVARVASVLGRPAGVRGLAVGGALVCTTVVAVSMAGEPENVVTSSEPEALPPEPTGPPSSVDGSDFVDTPPPAGPARGRHWIRRRRRRNPLRLSPLRLSPLRRSLSHRRCRARVAPVTRWSEPRTAEAESRTAEAESRTAGAERRRDRARTTARDRPVDRDFPVSGAVERSRGRHAAPPRLPDRGPQIQRDVIVRDKPSDDGREE